MQGKNVNGRRFHIAQPGMNLYPENLESNAPFTDGSKRQLLAESQTASAVVREVLRYLNDRISESKGMLA